MPDAPLLDYAEFRSQLRDLDVVAFEGRGFFSRLIRLGTRSRVTHVGFIVWARGRCRLLEAREMRGLREVHLSREIRRHGPVRVLRTLQVLDPAVVDTAVQWAMEQTGEGYSWRGIVRFGRRVLRRWMRLPPLPALEDTLGEGHRFCSEFVSAVLRLAGVDPCPDLTDEETAPGDLAASPRLRLLGRVR